MRHFSSGQAERMFAAIESLSYLQSALMPFINGTSIPCGEELYKVESLPNGCYTVWSWKGGSSLPIVQGPSSTNQCSITNDNHAYINDTLVATVYKSGNVVRTLKKAINTGCNFTGTYEQAPQNYNTWNFEGQPARPFQDGDTFAVFKGTTITLRSTKFIGATITHSGASPLDWTHSGDSISFSFRYFQPSNPILQSLEHTIIGSMTIDVLNNSTCEHSRFTVVGNPPITPIASSPILNINRQGQYVTVSLNNEGAGASMSNETNFYKSCTLTITNLATGNIIYQGKMNTNNEKINVSDWPAGIYVATIQAGNSSSTIKFILKS